MTMIKIDPDEMAVASSTLQTVGAAIGGTATGLRARAASAALPPTAAAEVAATLARVETTLVEVQKEVVLHATLLAVRGLLAARGATDVAGAATIEAPRTQAVAATTLAGQPLGTIPRAPIVGWTTVNGRLVPINATGAASPSGSGVRPSSGAKGDEEIARMQIAAMQNNAAFGKFYGDSPIKQSNREYGSGADLNGSGGVGDIMLGTSP